MNEKIITTDSINHAAWVLSRLSGRLQGFRFNGHRCEMEFLSKDGDVERAMQEFNDGGMGNVKEYVRCLGWLRNRVKDLSKENEIAVTSKPVAQRPLTPMPA